ncbi:MAG: lytic transglycosylase domain-containing protein [Coriobacteriia bacterium]|nr:lytic transglycosylase domain-containing protein [Coriobacteriia bacterium]
MSRERPLAPHRVALVAVAILLGALALLALNGPEWVQRAYRPLRHESRIADAADSYRLDPYLVAAVINVESGFDPGRVSKRGAVGLMQVMPATAEELRDPGTSPEEVTPERLKDPETNIEYGTGYLSRLVERYGGDVEAALAAYNAGPSNADRWRSEAARASAEETRIVDAIGFPETRRYVREVLRQRDDYERLYPQAFTTAGKGGPE